MNFNHSIFEEMKDAKETAKSTPQSKTWNGKLLRLDSK